MEKWWNLLWGVSPLLAPLITQVSNAVYTLDSPIINDNADDYNSPTITIDFSKIPNIHNEKLTTFDLEFTKFIDKRNRTVIKWRDSKNGKWQRYWLQGKEWNHKGIWIGNMIDDFIKNNQTIIFKNLIIGKSYGYDLSQPYFMLIKLFMFVFKVPYSTLIVNYADPDWFIGGTGIGNMDYPFSMQNWYYNKAKTKNGRYELCQDYFRRYKNKMEFIWNHNLEYIRNDTVFEGYDLETLWDTEWIRNVSEESVNLRNNQTI